MNMEKKICSKCGIYKSLDFFKKRNSCIDCMKQYRKKYYQNNKKALTIANKRYTEIHKEEKKAYNKKYVKKNKDKIKAYQKQYRELYKKEIVASKKTYFENNKEKISKRQKKYNINNKEKISKWRREYYINNRDRILEQCKVYNKNNRDKRNKRNRYRRKTDIYVKLREHLSKMVYKALTRRSSSKKGHSMMRFLPYSIDELKLHLQAQFEPWMTWDNHGKYEKNSWNDNDSSTWKWQLDHIIPHSLFHYTSMKDREFKECWSLENLRPLNAKQNWFDGIQRTRHK